MSYDENDAARDAFYEEVGNEAIGDFTADRLKSYYDDHDAVMQPALRALHEGKRLLENGHPSAAIVFLSLRRRTISQINNTTAFGIRSRAQRQYG